MKFFILFCFGVIKWFRLNDERESPFPTKNRKKIQNFLQDAAGTAGLLHKSLCRYWFFVREAITIRLGIRTESRRVSYRLIIAYGLL
jgi:hypothetical protein